MRLQNQQQLWFAALAAALVLILYAGMATRSAAQPAAGCGAPAPAAGESIRTIEVDGLARTYLLYVPTSYDGAQPVPLVFSLHGFASNPRQQSGFSQWNAIAEEETLIAVHPAGMGFPLRWSAYDVPLGPIRTENVDDVAFFAALIDALSEELCIDPARIYVNGLSNGGGMSVRLACELADRIAAIGTVAGAHFPLDACAPARPVPVIAFHGTADAIVPYEGNDLLPAVQDWARGWAELNGCDLTPEALPSIGAASAIRYSGCGGAAEVILYTIDDGGHTWPGSPVVLPPFLVGPTNQDLDATRLMWAFFDAHPLREGA
ncbi:MAG: PHB depolymerase family esterase [Aggregatilineales bacterium]